MSDPKPDEYDSELVCQAEEDAFQAEVYKSRQYRLQQRHLILQYALNKEHARKHERWRVCHMISCRVRRRVSARCLRNCLEKALLPAGIAKI